MYLKKLEIHGFKSFADKVEIDFKKGITGIVGPNGSGKSNVIDAVRWVLGEQSPKTLRGSKMEDIIFNGTSHRKPLGMSEVSLSFDNRDKILPIDYSEVTISRRIYRSGESEYLINRTPCRLKDVKELLMDTGIGIDGYSLIGQGQIDSILSNKPEERRQIFEEAAGIVKYKTRKKEAEKKLNNTNENLVRIEDIISELKARLEPLKNQSNKAQKFLNLNKELKELELNLFLNEIDVTNLKLESENKQLNIVEEQLNSYLKEKNLLIKDYMKCKTRIDNLESDIQNMKENYFQTTSSIKKFEGDAVLYKEKIQNIDKNTERISNEVREIEVNKEHTLAKLKNYISEKDSLIESITNNNNTLVAKNKDYEKLYDFLNDDENKVENLKGEVIDTLNAISSTKSEINSINAIRDNILKRVRKIDEEKKQYELETKNIKVETNKIKEDIDHLREYIIEKDSEKENLLIKNNELNCKYNDISNLSQKEQNNIRDMLSEKKLLEEMEKNYEGFNNSVRKTIQVCRKNEKLGKNVHGVVAELMTFSKGLETAMEVALGYSMQNIVCTDTDDAKRVIHYLKKNKLGRVTFIPINQLSTRNQRDKNIDKLDNIEGFIGKANELISCSLEYKKLFNYLLGRTLIVDNLNTATEITPLVNKYKIVTVEGDILNPGGTITGGSYKSKVSNIFSRKRKIKELGQRIDKSHKVYEKYKDQLEDYKTYLNSNNNRIQSISKDIEDLRLNLFKEESKLSSILKEHNSIENSIDNLNQEFISLDDELMDMETKIRQKKDIIADMESKNIELETEINIEFKVISENNKKLERLKEEITSIKINLASLSEKRDNCISEIDRLETITKEWETTKISKINELDSLKNEREKLLIELENINVKINDNKILSKQIDYNINKYSNEKKDLIQNYDKLDKDVTTINNTIDELKESLHKIEVKKTRLEMQKDSLIKKIWEKYELSFIDASNYKTEIVDYNEVNKRINYLKNEIKDLGEVSINSIKEYEEVNERFSFLSAQKDDLINAKNSLNKVIMELEETMRKQFVKSFNEINHNFKEIFTKLFNGGKAELILIEDSDVLDSNIEIKAQPPGKKLQNLSLLSGGERALTAIALLFSILKTKPTPFCILDEIEAALDDVNIFRFADFLKEFSKNSQFIIITHRKGTMEIIDYLYGITMQEYGVSKIVSVKLSDVDNIAS